MERIHTTALSKWFGLSPAETDRRANSFETRMRLLPDDVLVHEEWRRLLIQYQLSGIRVYDTHLIAVMNAYNVTRLLTYCSR